tara:strand:- start:1862 stop:1999 length:138 start_codon:yes stop_codon:yes gene_type:complete
MKITRKLTIVDENSPKAPAKKAPAKAKAPARAPARTTRKKAVKAE